MKSVNRHKRKVADKSIGSLLITVLGLLLLTASFSLLSPQAASAEISVTVSGDGVTNPITFTQNDLNVMEQVYAVYSTINTWPTKKWYAAEGVKLADLLTAAGIKDEAKLITVKSVDGFTKALTRQQLECSRYYYPGLKENHEYFGEIPGSPDGAVPVDTILALKSVEGSNDPTQMNNLNAPLLVMGQRWLTEQTNELYVKKVNEIVVTTAAPAKWADPTATPGEGTVPAGTLITLESAFNDADKVYYTTDGTDPTCQSPMYNWIASRWWSSRGDDVATINKPIELTRSTVIKAITIGPGREDSDIVTFNYEVPLETAPILTADSSNNTVGNDVHVTFSDNTDWREAIREVSVNGLVLEDEQYTKDTPGEIVINSDAFNTAGQYQIVVTALGYTDASVTQNMLSLINLDAPTNNQQFTKGQQVAINGTVEGSLASVNLSITDPDGQVIYGPQAIEVVNGIFETSYTPASNAKTGTYNITLEVLGMTNTINRAFIIKADSSIDPPAGDVVLTITGSGVAKEVKLTLAELQNMQQCQQVYSAVNTWPTKKWYVGKGVELRDLLDLAGMNSYNGLIKLTAADGFTITLTIRELLNETRYYFPNFKNGSDGDGHIPGSSAGAQTVEPIIALLSAEGTSDPAYMNDLNSLLFMLGQRAVTEQTGQLFVKNLSIIEVLSESPSQWDTPEAEPSSGEVPVGTLVKLSNNNMDDDKIHYTLDGSTPTINSPMYNWIASRWWSSRDDVLEIINHPIEIKEDTTIKAITIGPGKTDSDIATFTYKAKKAATNTTEKVKPGQETTVSLGTEATVLIPADALKEAVEVKIDKLADPPAVPTGFKLLGSIYEFSVDGKNSYIFEKSITLTLSFDPEKVGEGDVPAVYYYDQDLGEWVNIGGTVSNNTITVKVDHFTQFTVMAIEKEELEKKVDLIEFTDIAGHWAQKNIEQLAALGAVGGYSDGTFKPDNTITRAEFVTILVKAFKLEKKEGRKFADTAAHWAESYIAAALAHGIVSGCDNDIFRPDDLITREQMAVMIARTAKLSATAEKSQFADSDSVSPWARDAVTAVAGTGIMKGYPDNTFHPRDNTSRAEAVTVIINTLNKLNELNESNN